MKISKKINILDCTFRDGGYYNLWNFDEKLSKEYLKRISESKIDYIEIARGEAVKNGKAVINLNEFYGDTHGTSK